MDINQELMANDILETFICCACKLPKPRIEFPQNRSRPRGFAYKCNECIKIYRKTTGKSMTKKTAASRSPYKQIFYKIKENYGITEEQYWFLFKQQNGVCEICKEFPTPSKGRLLSLTVDHSHNSGRVRGLLCQNCNAMLGMAKDSLLRMQNGFKYLQKYADSQYDTIKEEKS